MIRWFRGLLYGSAPVEFRSSFALTESISRLQAATVRSVLPSFHKQAAVGTVTENKVSLRRVIPAVGNSFKPLFIGRFKYKNGQVVLMGRFTIRWFVKVFMTLWFGFCVLWTVLASVLIFRQHNPEQWWLPLIGLGMICAGAAMVRVGRWFARNDAAWLSEVIQAALSGVPPSQGRRGLF